MTKEIPLTQGKVALVDDEDYEWLMQWKWCYSEGYAVRGSTHGLVFMHRAVLEAHRSNRQGKLTDHRNRNSLDNRRSNLRPATHLQSVRNTGPRAGGSSRYKGVTFDKASGKWAARIFFKGRKVSLGRFTSETDAARAYDKAARRYFGAFAYLNFPPEETH